MKRNKQFIQFKFNLLWKTWNISSWLFSLFLYFSLF